jgi:acetoin utilization deacetylase AcuC-like enzyme
MPSPPPSAANWAASRSSVPRLFYCDHHEIPLPPGHKFPLAKYRMLREAIAAEGLFPLEPAPLASSAAIARAHDAEYVRQFLDGSLPPEKMRRIGFPWSEGLVRRTLGSAGGTLAATADALREGFGGTLAGGTHHAFPAHGAGFCVFNDVAIAIHDTRAKGLASRFAVIDLDVHQGDGTACFFGADSNVFALSLHAARNFPFQKQRSTLDLEFPDGAGDQEYLSVLRSALAPVFEFAPELIFYLSGVDALAGDRLGRLALTHAGLAERDRIVIRACREHGAPLVITLGGGYADPIERTVQAHLETFRIASEMLARAA